MSTQLTPEQEREVDACRVKWTAIGLHTGTIDREAATAALSVVYRDIIKLPLPPIEWCAGLRDAVHMRARYLAADANHDVPIDELPAKAHALERADYEKHLTNWSDNRFGGNAWASWHGWSEALHRVGVEGLDDAMKVNQLAEHISFWWPYDKVVIVCDFPDVLRLDDRGRLHGEAAPAVHWRDGYGMWFHHGVFCSEKVVMGRFEPRDVMLERNAEVRRAMCEIMGWEQIVRGLDAKKVSSDEFGTVWSLDLNEGLDTWDIDDGNKALLVEVLNSTPEPDGSIKTYFLSVDPVECEGWSATDCIGWTFNLPRGTYNPVKMT